MKQVIVCTNFLAGVGRVSVCTSLLAVVGSMT